MVRLGSRGLTVADFSLACCRAVDGAEKPQVMFDTGVAREFDSVLTRFTVRVIVVPFILLRKLVITLHSR